MTRTPELSAILVTDEFETVRTTVRHLHAQSARERIELVLVVPTRAEVTMEEEECSGFAGVVVARVPDLEPLATARAAGVEAARAPVVLFAESHSFPDARSVEALLDAHRGPWAAVGQAIWNANPATAISWSNLLIDYGPFMQTADSASVEYLPSHNSSFKRDALLDLGERLPDLIEFHRGLSDELRARGHLLRLEPRARTFHLQVSRPRSWLLERVLAGRGYAAYRAAEWPLWRRLMYAAGSPLIPVIRVRRSLADARRAGPGPWRAPRTIAALIVGLTASALGEATGYLRRGGPAVRRLNEMELHRIRHVRPSDRALDFAGHTAA